mmetsp:Transcript_62239/g.148520  ORF Transcript_62239/g.148520 Transcript_62239/m.148520 type:complete len:201 (-) Transcript_62239:167-769(-)|eukprot:CAMPEP_0178381634 /NCGR_PEP_ID=MMETSP0689_2-20121128/6087_1 /TAXON_ID=160604 /ORGANISM="Amphidinium massartii, Strain CS-259" /LENGTH=200 /DNA_ID=CAMNT_0020001829 /DNA_START=34 /DNA_END=636 /DNA_ORIENTATION=+
MGAECSHAAVSQCVTGIDPPTYSERCLLNHGLLDAARNGDHARVMAHIQAGANLETRKPLAIACDATDDSGRKVDDVAPSLVAGLTPLMLASKGGYVKCVRPLLEARAKVSAMDEDGMNSLHFAAQSGELDVARLLVENGADPWAQDYDGRAPIDFLPDEISKDVVKFRVWRSTLMTTDLQDFGSNGAGSTTGPSEVPHE